MANNLSVENKTMTVAMLAEGSSIRAIERVTGIMRIPMKADSYSD